METAASTSQTSRVSPIHFNFSFSAGGEDRVMMRAISDPGITVADFCRKTIKIMSTGDWVKNFCLIGSDDRDTKKMISRFNAGRTSFVNATLNYGDGGLPTVLRLQNSGSSSSVARGGVQTGVDVYVTVQKNCDDDNTPADELYPTDSLLEALFGYDNRVHVQICSVKAGEKWVPDDTWDEPPIQPIIVSYKDGKLMGKGRQTAKRRVTESSSESNNSKKKRVSNDEEGDEDQPTKESNVNDADAESINSKKGKKAATKKMESPKKKPRNRNPSVWDERLLDLVDFQIEHGDGTFPEPDSALGKWISTQRRQYGKKLSKEHAAQLDSLNINWESSENKSDSTTKTLNGKETNGNEARLLEEVEDADIAVKTEEKADVGQTEEDYLLTQETVYAEEVPMNKLPQFTMSQEAEAQGIKGEEPQPEEPLENFDEVLSTPQTAKKKEKKLKVRSEKKSNMKKSKKKSRSKRKLEDSIRIDID